MLGHQNPDLLNGRWRSNSLGSSPWCHRVFCGRPWCHVEAGLNSPPLPSLQFIWAVTASPLLPPNATHFEMFAAAGGLSLVPQPFDGPAAAAVAKHASRCRLPPRRRSLFLGRAACAARPATSGGSGVDQEEASREEASRIGDADPRQLRVPSSCCSMVQQSLRSLPLVHFLVGDFTLGTDIGSPEFLIS